MCFSQEKSQHILALNKGITLLRMLCRRLLILSPPWWHHVLKRFLQTFQGNSLKNSSVELPGGAGDMTPPGEDEETVEDEPAGAAPVTPFALLLCITSGQPQLLSTHFYILTLLLPFWLILTPYWPRILSTAACCNIPTRTSVREVFFTHLITLEAVLPENFSIFLCQHLHQLVIRKSILCQYIPAQKSLPNVRTVAWDQNGGVLRDSNPLFPHPSLKGVPQCWEALSLVEPSSGRCPLTRLSL